MRKNVTNKQMKSTYNLLRSGVFAMLWGGKISAVSLV